MTPDEVRKLVGGYATGSLTEAERRVLFEAALEDQELFDELAGEQVLKEVLDEPGARQRLLGSLEPAGQRAFWWMRPWPWAAAAATLAIAIAVVVSNHTPARQPAPQQIARVKSPEPVAAPAAPATTPPPVRVLRKASPPTAPAPKPPPAQTNSDAIAEVRQEQLADKLEAGAQPQPAAAAAPRIPAQAKGGAAGFVAGGRAAPPPVRSAENLTVNVATPFAFTYAVRGDGFLEIVPAVRGFLSVTAVLNNVSTVIFPSGAVSAGTALRIPIPPEAPSLVISFSGMPGITGSPVRRDEASGTVTDQDPPNGRIAIELFLKPATR